MILDLAIAFSCAGVGLVCGWLAHAFGWCGGGDEISLRDDLLEAAQRKLLSAEQERLAEVAERLREYATSMAMDVDEHQNSVQEFSDSLQNAEPSVSADSLSRAINQLIEANEAMQTKLQTAQSRIIEQSEQLESAERRAQTDALTRVSNRGAFDEHLARRHSLGPGRAGTLMLLDVDYFKRFNDEHGHRAGDEVLKVVANMLHARLKSYGIVARFGGEEFAAIIDGYSIDESKKIVESARAAISQHVIEFEGKTLNVTASIGLAEPIEDESIAQWIERADAAMYFSKGAGRNCGHWMNDKTPELITLDDSQPLIPETSTEAPSSIPEKTSSATLKRRKGMKKQVAIKSGESNRGTLASLPDREVLGKSFKEIQERSQSLGLPTQVMSVSVSGEPSAGSMRTLLQIVRATLRSIDRIGAIDANTLVVCMPGLNEESAQERVTQIRSSANSLSFGEGNEGMESTLTIHVVNAEREEGFDDVLSKVNEILEQTNSRPAEDETDALEPSLAVS